MIGWGQDQKEETELCDGRFCSRCVPPYSYLLCGKLVAMLAASNEVESFHIVWRNVSIQKKTHDGRWLITTTAQENPHNNRLSTKTAFFIIKLVSRKALENSISQMASIAKYMSTLGKHVNRHPNTLCGDMAIVTEEK